MGAGRIKSLVLERFKGIWELSLRPRRINVIVGRNNTGKTSILHAIQLYFMVRSARKVLAPYISWPYAYHLVQIGESAAKITVNSETIRIILDEAAAAAAAQDLLAYAKKRVEALSGSKERNLVFFLAQKTKLEKALDEYIKALPGRVEKGIRQKTLIALDMGDYHALVGELPSNGQRGHPMMDTEILNPPKEAPPIIDPLFAEGAAELLELEEVADPDYPKRLRELEEVIRRYGLLGAEFERLVPPFVELKGGKDIPIEYFGEGFRQFIGVAYGAAKEELPVVLLDEPSAFMHPGYTQRLVDFVVTLAQEGRQFFIVTHSPDLIEQFVEYVEREDVPEKTKRFVERETVFVQMGRTGNRIVGAEIPYPEARRQYEDFLLDLRGI